MKRLWLEIGEMSTWYRRVLCIVWIVRQHFSCTDDDVFFFIKLFIIGETIFHICFHYILCNMEPLC